jgi:hypothetical protein
MAMFSPSIPILHNGRWTLYAQQLGSGYRLTLVGEGPEVVEEINTADGVVKFKTEGAPFSEEEIARELTAMQRRVSPRAAEVTQ